MRTLFRSTLLASAVLILGFAPAAVTAQVTITNTNTNTNSGGGSWSNGAYTVSYPYYYNSSNYYPTYQQSIPVYSNYSVYQQPYSSVYRQPVAYPPSYVNEPVYYNTQPTYQQNVRYIGNGCSTYGTYSKYATIYSGCQCNDGYQWDTAGLQCVPASRVTYRDIDTGCWRADGRRETYPDPACSCGAGMQWNEARQCVPARYDYCSTIDVHSSWNNDEQSCICQNGYRAASSSRTCVRTNSKTSLSVWERRLSN